MTTAVEKMQFALDAIERHNSRVNAVISLADPDDLMKQAEAADQVPTEQRGPCMGNPSRLRIWQMRRGLKPRWDRRFLKRTL